MARLSAAAAHRARGLPASAVAGVDEVGAGCLAGPVVAACVVLPDGVVFEGLDDSKKMGRARREEVAERLRRWPGVRVGLGVVCAAEVDRLNVREARLAAMRAAVARVAEDGGVRLVLVDGDARLGAACGGAAAAEEECVVGGDGRCAAIAAASVVAKVARDGMMAAAAKAWPAYGFERNAGYGTREHVAALRAVGPCEIHRRSFRPVREAEARSR